MQFCCQQKMQSSRLYYSSRLLQVSTRTLLGLERISVILGILGVSRLISTCLTSQLHQIIPSYFLLGEIINSSIRHKLSYTSVFSPLMLKYPMNNYAVLSKRYRMQIRTVKIKHQSLCKVKWVPFRRFWCYVKVKFLLGEIVNSSIRHKLSYTSVFSPLMLKYPMNNYAVLSKRYHMQIRAVKIKHQSLCKVKWVPFRRF